ncbi:hypothetical protein BHE74_00036301 [Ensete ventricosum]|nr:hypothetical protein BHE74_00036301 [Ensete ventricosum]
MLPVFSYRLRLRFLLRRSLRTQRMAWKNWIKLAFLWFICLESGVLGATDPGDYAVLDEFRKGLSNSELLKWPTDNNDPCGKPRWPHVFCSGSRVTQIQVQNMGLSGPLPQNFNNLSMLSNIGLQRNNFTGKLPSFNGLSSLQYAYLDFNQFDTIPSDFFVGLGNLQVLALDHNPLNQSTGWTLPSDLANSGQLMNLSLIKCNLVGPPPEFLGSMKSLTALLISHNKLTGGIPASYSGMPLQILWLNDQEGPGLTGSIDVIASMTMLSDVWVHGNQFSGHIPSSIGALTSLKRLFLNGNHFVGLVPETLMSLPMLQSLHLDNNMLMGPIPKASFSDFSYADNSFCQSTPGVSCSPEVTALLEFLEEVNYPSKLTGSWSGDDPCAGPWFGISCSNGKVSIINLQNSQLSGTISESLGKLDSLMNVMLKGNNLTGPIPPSMTSLKSLKTLDLSYNNVAPPVPQFPSSVTVLLEGNKLLKNPPASPPAKSPPPASPPSKPPPPASPPVKSPPPASPPAKSPPPATPPSKSPPPASPPGPGNNNPPASPSQPSSPSTSRKSNIPEIIIAIATVVGASVILFAILFRYCCRKGKTNVTRVPPSSNVHLTNSDDPQSSAELTPKITINIGDPSGTPAINSGNLTITIQVLRGATKNFAPENVLGRGGFGVVYKGELHDGTTIAVKRMESGVPSNKALDEFHSEIAVLSKVRHRNLVSILGYSVEDNERLLVYEYMHHGALSKHLFQWKQLGLEPLCWKKRLTIALDVARGMEYLHCLANQSFIHRDLKSSNILLRDDYRAKVSDFGLVKFATNNKAFGIVLMELLTGMMALDEKRPDESRYLASWFCRMKASTEDLRSIIDPAIDITDETFEGVSIIAELAGHCAAREPNQRPDMGHAVGVLAPLVEKWIPTIVDHEQDYLALDFHQPLLQMVEGWQHAGDTTSSINLQDSKGSIPARPAGFAESFNSADGR